ncbi:MAG: hypothetical protein P4L46_05935 [Fimbriimonas sp.]|nr:hypothetical protein [Fimbriimonas sp.]
MELTIGLHLTRFAPACRRLWFYRLATLALLFAPAQISYGQSNLSGRVFLYDGSTLTNGSTSFSITGGVATGSASSGSANSNGISAMSASGATVDVTTMFFVRTYVYVNGSFSSTFDIRGPGSATDVNEQSEVETRSNRPLTIEAEGFTAIENASNSVVVPSVGTIAYTIRLHSGFPGGGAIGSGNIKGVDDAVNGQSSTVSLSQLPNSGIMSIRIQRKLKLNQLALGNTSYHANGVLILTVN